MRRSCQPTVIRSSIAWPVLHLTAIRCDTCGQKLEYLQKNLNWMFLEACFWFEWSVDYLEWLYQKNILQNIEMAVSQPCFEILWFLCFLHLPNTSRWLLQNWPVSQDSGKRKEIWNRWASHRAPCLGGSERSMQCRMPVRWIRHYRPLHHPVNLRLAQAEIENMSTLFRGCDHSSNHRPSTCRWIDDDWR